jgi:hypothetical protein
MLARAPRPSVGRLRKIPSRQNEKRGSRTPRGAGTVSRASLPGPAVEASSRVETPARLRAGRHQASRASYKRLQRSPRLHTCSSKEHDTVTGTAMRARRGPPFYMHGIHSFNRALNRMFNKFTKSSTTLHPFPSFAFLG